jgi:hypothetical protein
MDRATLLVLNSRVIEEYLPMDPPTLSSNCNGVKVVKKVEDRWGPIRPQWIRFWSSTVRRGWQSNISNRKMVQLEEVKAVILLMFLRTIIFEEVLRVNRCQERLATLKKVSQHRLRVLILARECFLQEPNNNLRILHSTARD